MLGFECDLLWWFWLFLTQNDSCLPNFQVFLFGHFQGILWVQFMRCWTIQHEFVEVCFWSICAIKVQELINYFLAGHGLIPIKHLTDRFLTSQVLFAKPLVSSGLIFHRLESWFNFQFLRLRLNCTLAKSDICWHFSFLDLLHTIWMLFLKAFRWCSRIFLDYGAGRIIATEWSLLQKRWYFNFFHLNE